MNRRTKSAPERSETSYRTLMTLVSASEALRKAGNRFFERHELTQSQFNVLMVLKHDAPSGCSQSELCGRLLVNAADVSGLVRRMLARGLLSRADHPEDPRAWLVTLSDKGRRLLEQIEPSYYRQVKHAMGLLSPRQARLLSDLLQQVHQGILGIQHEAA